MSNTSKSYRLTDSRSGESFMLKTGKKGTLTIFDSEANGGAGARRAIRHCPNQKSIFMDLQDQHALVVPIIFQYGQLEVDGRNPITQLFLDNHPSNSANTEDGSSGWFETVNEEQENKESITDEELQNDIMYAVRQMAKTEDGIHELSIVVSVLLGNFDEASEMGIETLKRVIYNEIKANPYYFADESGNVTIFEDTTTKRKYITLRAIKEGVLKKSVNNRSILWARDGKIVATAPRSVDLIEYFADFLTTDEGILVAEEIEKRS